MKKTKKKRRKKRTKKQLKVSLPADRHWNKVRDHIHSANYMEMEISKIDTNDMDDRLYTLYEALDIPFKGLSFYAQNS